MAQRWRLEELTVSYRTPAEIMAVAAEVLARDRPGSCGRRARCGTAACRRGTARCRRRAAGRGAAVAAAARRRPVLDRRAARRCIVPAGRVDELGAAVTAALPEAAVGEQPELESRVVVLTVAQAKGLEFDSVLVVDPDRIVAESPRGAATSTWP